jgi:pyoverdine/dityrosine biosynthesis protein Dit1
MLISQLPHNDQLFLGATHYIRVTHEDITETTANADQTLDLAAVAAGEAFRVVAYRLEEAFKDTSDTGFNDVQFSFGDDDDADRYLTATQVNENGTEVLYKAGALSAPYVYTAAKTLKLLVENMATPGGEKLSDLDKGIALFFVQKIDLDEYGDYK